MDGTASSQRSHSPETQVKNQEVKNQEVKKKIVLVDDEWSSGSDAVASANDAASDADNDVDNDADNTTRNSKKEVAVRNLLLKLSGTLPEPTAPAEQDNRDVGAYDCREFARFIRGNWKIIAPSLTAVSSVTAIALLTIGARGSVAGEQLSFGARWGMWIAGYMMTQAAIAIGTGCIPSTQVR